MNLLSKDKLKETHYNFNRVIETLKEIENSTDILEIVGKIQLVRYDLNSFVNSSRSVTLVLQKDFKTKFRPKFENWYTKEKMDLDKLPFAKILLELRNINQKEGNIYPTFEFISELENDFFTFELDYTKPIDEIFVNEKLIAKGYPNEKPNLKNKSDEIKIKEPNKDFEDEVFKFAAIRYNNAIKEVNEKNNFKLHMLKIDRFDIDLSKDEFLQKCREILNVLTQIVKKSSDLNK
ncbi:MAG: hypothetical protein H7141_03525 [Burkholderiales bacterium]|nr:hypothetical protein [Bacteroidia bacterium]